MVQKNFFLQSVLLLIFVCSGLLLHADTPCEDAGYVISTHANATKCPGTNTGSATVASNGCDCMFSGCQFLWSDGQTNHTAIDLAPGVYSVTVIHPNGCVLEDEVIIDDAPAFVEKYEISTISCAGESDARLEVVSANFEQLDISWSTGDTGPVLENLGPGAYVVFATNVENCVVTETFIIEEPQELRVECLVSPPCEGSENGVAKLEIEGGVPPYSLEWFGIDSEEVSISNLAIGSYEVLVTDGNDCSQTMEVEIPTWEQHLKVEQKVAGDCVGSTVQLVAPLIPDATYEWSPAIGLDDPSIHNPIATVAGETYELRVTAGSGCSAIVSHTVATEGLNVPTLSSGALDICKGEYTSINVFMTGAVVSSYSWEPTTGISNPNSNAIVANPQETTTYVATAQLADGCTSSVAVTIEVEDCENASGLADINASGAKIYPNPANDVLFLSLEEKVELRVFSINGQQVHQAAYQAGQSTLAIHDWKAGIYFLQLQTAEGVYQQKLIVE